MYPIAVQHQVLVTKHKGIKGMLKGIMDSMITCLLQKGPGA